MSHQTDFLTKEGAQTGASPSLFSFHARNASPVMDFDHELLLSVASGLGRWSDGPDGAPVYTKDADCVGE